MSDPDETFRPTRLADYSEKNILAEIRRVVLEECDGVVPNRDRFEKLARVSHWTIAKRFGSYTNGIKRAGFGLHRQSRRPKVTKDQVETNLLDVLKQTSGYRFSQMFYRRNGGVYCEETVKARLGVASWEGVMTAIGAKAEPRVKHTVVSQKTQRQRLLADLSDMDLLAEITRVWEEMGRRPKYSEFRQLSQYGIRVYETRYGTWTKAVETFCQKNGVDFLPSHRKRWATPPSRDILLDELRAVQVKQPGTVLTYDIYKSNGGTHSRSVFARFFGGWTNAVNATGGVSGKQAKWSRDELFGELQRLWELLSRQPKQVEMSRQGRVSPKCYFREFGSWSKAIHAFCADRSTMEEVQSTNMPANVELVTAVNSVREDPGEARIDTSHTVLVPHKTSRTVSLRLRFKVLQRDSFRCTRCGRSPAGTPGLELEVDHAIPYSRGGETEMDNLQTLCRECNRGKADSIIDLPNQAIDNDKK